MATFAYLDFCTEEAQPLSLLREQVVTKIKTIDYSRLEDGNASLRALCYCLSNLSKPIKLVRPKDVFQHGRFPRYDECDESNFGFTKLDAESFSNCIAISHRWTDKENSLNNLDVEWLKKNWHQFEKNKTENALFFYDYTSLPQKKKDGAERDVEEQITFKAGLELIDHVFSHRAIVIPTKGYLFRYWCYVEFFVASYHGCLLSGIPFLDPLPRDLNIMDSAIQVTHKAIVKSKLEFQDLFEIANLVPTLGGLLSLGEKSTSDLVGCVAGLIVMKRDGKEGTMKVILRRMVEMRSQIANMVRSRMRQCSLTVADDKAYLDTILSSYIDAPRVEMHGLNERYEQWDVGEAAESLKDSIQSYAAALMEASTSGDGGTNDIRGTGN